MARRAPFLVGAGVLVLYVVTLAPSLVWGDGGRLQTDAITGGSLYWYFDELAGVQSDGWPFDRLGIAAWDHPTWVMAGHGLTKLPIGADNYLLNLLSAVPAAAAVALIYVIVCRLGRNVWGAALGALSLAVSHTYWFHAVTAEVYALHALFMAALLYLGLRWARRPTSGLLVATALVSGLGLANHLMLALTIVPVAIFMYATRPRGAAAGPAGRPGPVAALAALAFVAGLSPWWVQFLRMGAIAGFSTTTTIAAGFPWLGDRWPGSVAALPANVAAYGGFLVYQFTPFGLAAAGYGAYRLWGDQREVARLVLGLYAVHAVFSINYDVADQYAFHLPSYVVLAVLVGYGVSTALGSLARASDDRRPLAWAALAVVALPVAMYAAVPPAVKALGLDDADLGIPTIGVDQRDGIGYFLNPMQTGDDSAAAFGRSALESLPQDALVLTAWPLDLEPYVVMRHYQLTEGLRPDVKLELMVFTGLPLDESVLAITASQRGCRAMYLASRNPDAYPLDDLERNFRIVADAHLYRLDARDNEIGDCLPYAPATATLDDLVRNVRR